MKKPNIAEITETNKKLIEKILSFKNLTESQAKNAMLLIMENKMNECQKAAFLTALRMKGVSVSELYGFVKAMLEKAVIIRSDFIKDSFTQIEKLKSEDEIKKGYYIKNVDDIRSGYATKSENDIKREDAKEDIFEFDDLVDTCGSGGDNKNTFNISTTAAFIAAGAGVKVVKHGNRSISSNCGSADVLEALGIKITTNANNLSLYIKECLKKSNLSFIFAPIAHPAMASAAKTRKDLKFKTVFNILGPIVNPVVPKKRVIGIYDYSFARKIAKVLIRLNVKRAIIASSADGMDELSVLAPTYVTELNDNCISQYTFYPKKYGFNYNSAKYSYSLKDLHGGSPHHNAQIILDILKGRDKGIKRDIAVLNAAAAILVGKNLSDFKDAIEMAIDSIDSGNALRKMENLIEITNKFDEFENFYS